MTRNVASVLLLCCLAACAGAPVQEMSDARQAIAAAQAAGAPARAPENFLAAKAAIERAETRLHEHDYVSARSAAVEAKHDASVALAQSQGAAATH